jgi:hypothetical protein
MAAALAIAPALWAQQPAVALAANTAALTERTVPVTQSDLYCAGFLLPKPLPRHQFVAGGQDTPLEARYGVGDYLFLRGSGYAPGTRISLVRDIEDPNRNVPFPAARNLLGKAGHLYEDLGYAAVVELRGRNIAVARVEFACASIVPGDLVTAFTSKAPLSVRPRSVMDRFPPAASGAHGQIVAARDFDQYIATGKKIYVNVGGSSGVKAGDYLRIVRNYERRFIDPADAEALNQTSAEDTQKNPPTLRTTQLGDLPSRVIGEAIVLSAQPASSTAMITFSMEEAQLGDVVELEEAQTQ